jgi:hypothetical protein
VVSRTHRVNRMNNAKTIDVLNRLYVLHNRSLPIYLRDAAPAMRAGNEAGAESLAHIIEDHEQTLDRLGTMILDRGGIVEQGRFPIEFTGWHDLSFDYLLTQLIERQRRDIRATEACVRELDHDPEAKAVAEEVLGQAKGHLDSLVELTQEPATF